MKPRVSIEAAKKHSFFKLRFMLSPQDYYLRLCDQGIKENLITKEESIRYVRAFKELHCSPDRSISQLELIIIARATATRNKWYWEDKNIMANRTDNILNKALNAELNKKK